MNQRAAPRQAGIHGCIFDIKRDASDDGPGLRTTVFFKGCPLACVWCQNPEGLGRPRPEGVGETLSVERLYRRVIVDRPFFQHGRGGVTLSGGEPTLQMGFAGAFLRRLKRAGVHTAIETCGHFPFARFREEMLPWLDLIYFDLKLIDPERSLRYTGQSNALILENFDHLLQEASIPILPRIPLIPEITDRRENLAGWGDLLRKRRVNDCGLLAYNPLWHDKARKLDIEPDYPNAAFMSQAAVRQCAAHLQSTSL